MSVARRSCNREKNMPLRCLIVDDNASFRAEVRGLLQEQGLDVVGTAGSADEALRLIAELRPDVALIDVDLGGESGLDLARRLGTGKGGEVPRSILISTYDEREYADLIAASPAVGFLAKTDLSAAAIHRILGGTGDSQPGSASPSDEHRGT
jgi:DNA-binding NarL/FixJ family response regulator